MSPLFALTTALVVACTMMSLVWWVQYKTGNAGWVDVAWSGVIGVIGVFFSIVGAGDPTRRAVVGAMMGLWSLRLTAYLFRRVGGHPEEGRYVTLRKKWGQRANTGFFGFFQMQALAALFFATPALVIANHERSFGGALDITAVALWAAGVLGVAIADSQLKRFKQRDDSRGKTCRQGLWGYSRHPNYFFEWVHWCAYVPLAIGGEWWWAVPLVPAVLLYFFFFVTGIPPTEAQAVESRGDDYRNYQRTTSVFVPWFVKGEQ